MWEHHTVEEDLYKHQGRSAIALGYTSLLSHSDAPNCIFVRHIDELVIDVFAQTTDKAWRGTDDRLPDDVVVRSGPNRLVGYQMDRDPYDIAIDQILEGADGDVRLALRTVLIQNVELQARLKALSERVSLDSDFKPHVKGSLN